MNFFIEIFKYLAISVITGAAEVGEIDVKLAGNEADRVKLKGKKAALRS